MTDQGGFRPPDGPPAGWYPDPYGGPGQRYWDGHQWDLTTGASAASFDYTVTGDFPDIGDWLDRSFRSAYRRWRALTLVALLTAPASTALSYAAINRAFDGLFVEDGELYGWTDDRIPVVVILGVLAALIGAIGSLAVSVLMLRAIDGDDATDGTWRGAFSAALRSLGGAVRVLPRALGWFIVLAAAAAAALLVVTILVLALGAFGVVIVFAAIPAVVWLLVKWSFVVVAIVDRPGNPLTRSGAVSTGRWLATFGRLLLVLVVITVVSIVVQIAISLVSGAGAGGFGSGPEIVVDEDGNIEWLDFEELTFGAAEMIAGSVGSVLTTVMASSVLAAGMSILYRTRNRRS